MCRATSGLPGTWEVDTYMTRSAPEIGRIPSRILWIPSPDSSSRLAGGLSPSPVRTMERPPPIGFRATISPFPVIILFRTARPVTIPSTAKAAMEADVPVPAQPVSVDQDSQTNAVKAHIEAGRAGRRKEIAGKTAAGTILDDATAED